jgi:hypothetical protein
VTDDPFTIAVPRLWWSATDRVLGPLFGALLGVNILEASWDTSIHTAVVDTVLSVLVAVALVIWFRRGRELDHLAVRSYVLMERTFGIVHRGDAIVTIDGGGVRVEQP